MRLLISLLLLAPFSQAEVCQMSPKGEVLAQIATAEVKHRSPELNFRTVYKNRMIGEPITTARGFGEKIHEMISSAKEEVILQAYHFDKDTWIARKIKEAIHSLGPTVDVRVSFSLHGIPVVGTLPNNKKKAAEILAFLKEGAKGDLPNIEVGPFKNDHIYELAINHSKYVIIDNKRVMVLNANISNGTTPLNEQKVSVRNVEKSVPFQPSNPGTVTTKEHGLDWYQLGIIFEGEIAGEVRNAFVEAWNSRRDKKALKSAPTDMVKKAVVLPESVRNQCLPLTVVFRSAEADNHEVRNIRFHQKPKKEVKHVGFSVSQEMSTRGLGESGTFPESAANKTFKKMFDIAESTLRIHTPNLNKKSVLEKLVDVALKENGPKVKIILSKGYVKLLSKLDARSNAETAEFFAEELTGKACNLEIRWHSADQFVPEGEGISISHTKYASIDDELMIIGSQNMDKQSWIRSRELNVLVDDAEITKEYDAFFEEVWDRSPTVFSCDR